MKKKQDPVGELAGKQLEWFQASFDYHCEHAGKGTQRRISEVLDVHETFISHIRHDIRKPRLYFAFMIAAYFGMTFADFLEIGRGIVDPSTREMAIRGAAHRRSRDRLDMIYRDGQESMIAAVEAVLNVAEKETRRAA